MTAERRTTRIVHARKSRQPAGPTDRRRLVAATLSAIFPGLGQVANGRTRLAKRFGVPALGAVVLVWLLFQLFSTPRIVATALDPAILGPILVLNILAMLWRFSAVGQAFFDQRFAIKPGRLGNAGLVALLLFVAVPHLVGLQWGLAARDSFGRIFVPGATGSGQVGGSPAAPELNPNERTNILVIGLDTTPWRTATLTDTMMVVSLDPVGKSVSMLSIPRDMVNVPLGNGDVYGPKLNSLMAYADNHPAEFPAGGVATLQRAVGALLDIRIHYYATLDFVGFIKIVDTLGGVTVDVEKGFTDPEYKYESRVPGYSITAGRHHLTGVEALGFVRARKGVGESDFTRAARQQQVLLALRNQLTANGSLLLQVPTLFNVLGDTVRTSFPVSGLDDAAVLLDEIEDKDFIRVVIRAPLVRGTRNEYGSVQVPDVPAIRAMAGGLFSEPGDRPTPWPTPQPTATPRPTTTAP
jgi:LCP family protein required for cell wall assembly